jgi:hypothetical protein
LSIDISVAGGYAAGGHYSIFFERNDSLMFRTFNVRCRKEIGLPL